jgi:hypothetical protein
LLITIFFALVSPAGYADVAIFIIDDAIADELSLLIAFICYFISPGIIISFSLRIDR